MRADLAEHGYDALAEPPARYRSFPAWLPRMSLDKAFARGMRVDAVDVPTRGPARDASDHLPLVVECVPR